MQRLRLTTLLISFAVSAILACPQAQYGQHQQSNNTLTHKSITQQLKDLQTDEVIIEASFEKPLPAAKIQQLLASKKAKVEYLMYRWGEHTGWYVLADGESVEQAVGRFEQQHSQFLEKQIVDYADESMLTPMSSADTSKTPRQLQESQARLAQEFVDQLSEFRNNGLVLSGFAVKGNRETLPSVIDSLSKGTNYRMLTKSNENLQTQTKTEAQAQASGTPYPNESWRFSPSSGVISYDKNSKYFTSRFSFTDVSGFNSTHSAYEHDITIWSLKDSYIRPGRGARYTNLPSPYVDTTAMDTYASFTIGTTDATQIKVNNSYYTDVPVEVIKTSGGPSSGSIQPQLGSWAGAYDEGEGSEAAEKAFCAANLFAAAYCVFADQTHTIKDYFTNSSPTSARDFPFDHRISSSYNWKSQTATPSITPGSLTSQSPVKASISTTTNGAIIRYTTNGSEPNVGSTIYSSPLTFNSSVTLKAKAFRSGMTDSNVASATYSIKPKVATPTISPGSLSSQASVKASISTPTTGATIRYTTNGSDPTTSSAVYSVPLTFNSSVTLKARAFKSGMTESSVTSVTYSIVPKAVTPSITGLDYMSAPIAGSQFIVRVRAVNVSPASVRVVVTGPGCQTFGACTVSNSILRNFGVVSASLIEKVPLTLSAGSYRLYLQNGSSLRDPVSQGDPISVLAPAINNPVIAGITYLSTAVSGKQFTVKIDGRYFVSSSARVVVTGPGCTTFGSCSVSNKALRDFGSVSSTRLAKVPLTLGAGNYKVFVQNGTSAGSPVSSAYTITVNNPVVALEVTQLTLLTTPKRGKQFFSRIEGRGFNSNQIRVVVTGPGCTNFGVCAVPNNVLRSFGSISATRLSKVPMTLGKGTYKVYVQNGTSFRDPVSGSVSVSVK